MYKCKNGCRFNWNTLRTGLAHFHVPIAAGRRARVPSSAFVFSILVTITDRKLIISNKHSGWLRRILRNASRVSAWPQTQHR